MTEGEKSFRGTKLEKRSGVEIGITFKESVLVKRALGDRLFVQQTIRLVNSRDRSTPSFLLFKAKFLEVTKIGISI